MKRHLLTKRSICLGILALTGCGGFGSINRWHVTPKVVSVTPNSTPTFTVKMDEHVAETIISFAPEGLPSEVGSFQPVSAFFTGSDLMFTLNHTDPMPVGHYFFRIKATSNDERQPGEETIELIVANPEITN